MSTDLRAVVLESLSRVAPEADPGALRDDDDIREELDLDSMDFLAFVTALHDRLGVDVPESEYRRLATVAGAVAYLHERQAGS